MHFALFDDAASGAVAYYGLLVVLIAIGVLWIAGMWRIFTKAGRPGWLAIIPFVNYVILLHITGRSGWWLLVAFVPGVDLIFIIIFQIIVYWDVGRAFGQNALFRLGLIIFPYIFVPILGFGNAQFVGARPTYVALPPDPQKQRR